ncbi:hypothetical protein JCM14076_01810 [Methylosoma difficile]
MIYFLSGALRSGTTLLHLMLDHHPQLVSPGEFDFMFDLIGDDGQLPTLDKYYEFLQTSRIFNSKALIIDKSLGFVELIHSFAQQLKKSDNVLILNVHRNFHRIFYIFPEAKYIHLLRDPRDVSRSSIEMGWCGNVYFGVDHWIASERSWDVLASRVDDSKIYSLNFEGLVLNPEDELNKVCVFLGVIYSPQMLDYPKKSSYKKPDKALASQWTKRLSRSEIQHVESKASDLMLNRGYALSGLPLKHVSILGKAGLLLQNKIFRLRFGINRYGFILFAKELLSRRLGFKAFHEQCVLEKNQIDKQHLR